MKTNNRAKSASSKGTRIKITAEQRKSILDSADPNSGLTADAVDTLSDVLESSMNVQISRIRSAAVKSANESAQKQWRAKARSGISKVKTEMAKKLDMYLDHVVESWTKKNRVALKATVENQRNKKILSTVMKVFEKLNFKVPASKQNVIALMSKSVREAKQLAESRQAKVNVLQTELRERRQAAIVSNAMKGMTASQRERVIEMAKNVKFTDMNSWKGRVQRISEAVRSGSIGKAVPQRSAGSRVVIESRSATRQPVGGNGDLISKAAGMFSSLKS